MLGRLLTANGSHRHGENILSSHSKKPRPFKSAEKPVSLHPLSYKQALQALLQVGPILPDPPGDEATGKRAISDDQS